MPPPTPQPFRVAKMPVLPRKSFVRKFMPSILAARSRTDDGLLHPSDIQLFVHPMDPRLYEIIGIQCSLLISGDKNPQGFATVINNIQYSHADGKRIVFQVADDGLVIEDDTHEFIIKHNTASHGSIEIYDKAGIRLESHDF